MTSIERIKPVVVPADSKHENKSNPAPAEAVKARRRERDPSKQSKGKTRKPHVIWTDDEISSILAWICKNKGSWEMNKRMCVDHFNKVLVKGRHSPQAIYIKIHHLEVEFSKCFEFVLYKEQDKPVRKAIPAKVEKVRFFKECRAAFGLPVYTKGLYVRKVDDYPPTKSKEKTPPVPATATVQDQPPRETPSDPAVQTKRVHPESEADAPSPPPIKKARRTGVVADDNNPPSPQLHGSIQRQEPVESEDVPDSPVPAPAVIANEAHAPAEDQTHELKLKRQELQLLIQGTEVKIERSEVRFERLREKHEYHQERRRQRLAKYRKELNRLIVDG